MLRRRATDATQYVPLLRRFGFSSFVLEKVRVSLPHVYLATVVHGEGAVCIFQGKHPLQHLISKKTQINYLSLNGPRQTMKEANKPIYTCIRLRGSNDR